MLLVLDKSTGAPSGFVLDHELPHHMISMKNKRPKAEACRSLMAETELTINQEIKHKGKSLRRVLEAKERQFFKLKN